MTSPPPSPSIRLGGRDIAIGSISYITAEEHFVHLETEEGCITHRARISDIVAQLPPELGVQPHRSWWVSRQSNPRLDREGNRHVLHLGCGLSVPVARARIPNVTAWFEQQHN